MPVAIADAPLPSRSTATSTSVSLVVRLTEPLRMRFSGSSWSFMPRAFYQGLAGFATAAAAAIASSCPNA